MFTGLIEEIGTLRSLAHQGTHYRLTIAASRVLENIRLGDSIATNGVCLTVAQFSANSFSADVMPETLRRTNLATLRVGEPVNLERALALGSRLGGHIVSGHIDGTGVIKRHYLDRDAIVVSIAAAPEILQLIVPKGSIAIDGISLTVVDVDADTFSVSLVNHTQHNTTLSSIRVGETVNLENDILAKYVQRLLSQSNNKPNLLDLL